MPRKAPKEVTEHRITLGDYERKMLTKQLNEDDLLNKAATGAQIGKTVAITGAVIGGTIAAGTIGMLAVSAYREANNLVEGAQDISAGVWSTLKWRMGLISFDDYLQDVQEIVADPTPEELAEKERRENMGFLEWGLDNVLTFLLGKDKKWTRTSNVTVEDLDLDQQTDQEVEPTIEVQYGSVENFNRIMREKHQYLSAIAQFCRMESPDYDPQVCNEVKEDYQEWRARNAEYLNE